MIQISVEDLVRYHKVNLGPTDHIRITLADCEPSTSDLYQAAQFDLTDIVIDAHTLEAKLEEMEVDHTSEYERTQREHRMRFREEVQLLGLQVKPQSESTPTPAPMNY